MGSQGFGEPFISSICFAFPCSLLQPRLPPLNFACSIGMAIAHPAITQMLVKVQMPYKISNVTLSLACRALAPKRRRRVRQLQSQIVTNRATLCSALGRPLLARSGIGRPIGGNAANFVVVPIFTQGSMGRRDDPRAKKISARLREMHGIAVRYIGAQAKCEGCLRITVGTVREIKALIRALEQVVDEC